MDNKEILATRFKQIYPGKRLLAVQLDGFSHKVYMDDGTPNTEVIIERKNCAPEQKGNGTNTPEVHKLLADFPNYIYQNNAKEIVYVLPNER